jgi:hypothetical protein
MGSGCGSFRIILQVAPVDDPELRSRWAAAGGELVLFVDLEAAP